MNEMADESETGRPIVTPPAAQLFEALKIETDEIAVVSAIFADSDDQGLQLAQASVVIGVDALGTGDWSAWESMHGRPAHGGDPGTAAFLLTADGLVGVRQPVSVPEAMQWLSDIQADGRSAALGKLPAASAELSSGSTTFISPRLANASAQHVIRSVRPGRGVLYPLATPTSEYPNTWVDEAGTNCYVEGLPLGLHGGDPETQRGLVVMRQSRTAWISHLRADESGTTYRIGIGHDPSRIDVGELELTFEEMVNDEVIHARRLRLDQVETDQVRGKPEFVVRVPSVGHNVRRKVTLYSSAGEMLDMTSIFWTLQRLAINVNLIGSTGPGTTSTFGLDPTDEAHDRDALVEDAELAWSDWLGLGVDQQVFPPGSDLRAAIRSRLSSARGELLIADRYFGKNPSDWEVTDDVSVAVRAVVSLGAAPTPARSHVDVRWLRPKKLTMHGRYYLWDGGGLYVDNSPGGFPTGVTTITRIDPFASGRLRDIFDTIWWANAKTNPPRATPSTQPSQWARFQRNASKRLKPLRKRARHLKNKAAGRWRQVRTKIGR